MIASVEKILSLIDELPEPDRFLLQQRLAERAELAWQREAELARVEANQRGVDDQAIDDAIERHRYGR